MQKKERLLLVNRLCEQFESNLKSGASEGLERVLDATAKKHADPNLLQALLPELIALEVYYSDDREAAAASLASRFPEQTATIQNALDQPSVNATLDAGGDQTNVSTRALQSSPPTVRLGRRFTDLQHHASGGLGDVYVGYDTSVRRQVAIKLLRPELVADTEAKSRFLNEAAITAELEHPGIVPIYDSGISEEGQPFYAMRLLGGDTLKDAVVSLHKNRGAEDFEERQRQLIRRLIDVCDAISCAHDNGVIHRDLKPANIVLGSYGETVVIDWGLARSESTGAQSRSSEPLSDTTGNQFQTRLGSVLGTPAYMSPEQASGIPENLTPSSDVYSLGAILYSILTGAAPISDLAGTVEERLELVKRADFPSARQRVGSVPPGLNEICARAMRLNPAERYATPRELAQDLDNWLSDQPVVAKPDTMLERGFRFLRKHRRWATAAAATLVAITVGSTVAATIINKQSGELETRKSEAERQAKENADLAAREAENARLYLQAGDDNRAYVDFVTGVFQTMRADEFGKDARLTDVLDEIKKQLAARDDLSSEATRDILITLASAYLVSRQDVKALEMTQKYVDLSIKLDGTSSFAGLDGRLGLARALVNVQKPKKALEVIESTIKDLDRAFPDLAAGDAWARLTRRKLIRAKITALQTLGRGEEERAAWEELCPWLLDLDLKNLPTTQKGLHVAGQYVEMLRRTGVTTGQALEWQKKIYEGNKQLSDGSDSSRLLGSLFRLSQAISTQQGPTAALPYRKELVERASEFFGPTHQNTLVAKSNLADTLYKVGEYQESRDRLLPLQRTYQSKGTHLNHLSIVESKLARVQLVLGNEKDALEIIRAVQQRISESEEIDQLGATGTIAMELLSLAQMENGLIDEALKSVTHEVELFEAAGKPEDPDVRPRLQLAYMLNGDFDSALKQREHFHSLSEVSHNTIFQSANTAECLFVKGKHEEATELVKKILALPPNVSPAARVATSKCLQSHMRGLMARIIAEDDPKESERLLLQAVTELSDNSPQLLSNTLRVRALKQHEKNLIELYSSTGRETEAEQWKKRLDL